MLNCVMHLLLVIVVKGGASIEVSIQGLPGSCSLQETPAHQQQKEEDERSMWQQNIQHDTILVNAGV